MANLSFLTSKKRFILIALILGLSLLYLFKSCGIKAPLGKEYSIGQESRWEHFGLLGKERNLAAFNYDLLLAIAKEEKIAIRMVNVPIAELISNLQQGKLQGALTTLQPPFLHENQFIFSNPYFLTGPVLIIPLTTPMQGWNENRKKIVGIQANSHPLLNLDQDPSMQLKLYSDIWSAFTDLNDRRIDGVIWAAIPAYTYVSTFYRGKLKIATLPLSDEGIRLVALKNPEGEELIQHFNAGLSKLKKEGAYADMLKRLGLINTEQIQP